MNLKKMVIHPFLFAAFPVILLYLQNIDEVYVLEIIFPLFISWILIGISFFLLNLFIKNTKKTAIILSMAIIIFFFYMPTYDLLLNFFYKSFGLLIIRHRYFLVFTTILFVTCSYLIYKSRERFDMITTFLNIFSLMLLLISLFTFALYVPEIIKAQQKIDTFETTSEINYVKAADNLPDIYYIVLDGYARADILKDFYNYDNSPFLDDFEKKGFYVVHNSSSNYAATFLSLASTFEMEYVNYFADEIGLYATDRRVPYSLIEDNKATRFLKSKGYKYIHISSGWGATRRNKNADKVINPGYKKEFNAVLLSTTIIEPFIIQTSNKREGILTTFEILKSMPEDDSLKFVFAHLMLPHEPHVFDRDGNPVIQIRFSLDTTVGERAKRQSIDQLIFTNKKVTELVDILLESSEKKPVIIIQSDHGTDHSLEGSWFNVNEHFIKERMSNLNLIYLPNQNYDQLHERFSPVNTFRMLFNLYFDTEYELLEDKSYFSDVKKYPYAFMEVKNKDTEEYFFNQTLYDKMITKKTENE